MISGRAAIALLLVGGASLASGAEPIRYSKQVFVFAVMDVPASAVQSSPGSFDIHHDGADATINLEASTPHFDDRTVDCEGGRLAYKLDRPNLLAYSCALGPEIIYSITKFGRTYLVGASNATEEIGYTIRYPASQRRYWDPVIAHMNRTLRFAR